MIKLYQFRCIKTILAAIAFMIAFHGLYAHAQSVKLSAPTTVTVTSTSTLEFPANAKRAYLIISNTGSQPAIIKFGSVQSGSEGLIIPPSGNYEPLQAPANTLYAKTASSTTTLVIIEGTYPP